MNDNFVPTPQAILNHTLKELCKGLDAAQKSRELLLKQLKDSSPLPDLQRAGVVSLKRKDEAAREVDRKKTRAYEDDKIDRLGETEPEVKPPEKWD